MKKILSTLFIAAAIVGFTACGEPKPATDSSTESAPMDSSSNTTPMQGDTTATPMQPQTDTMQNN